MKSAVAIAILGALAVQGYGAVMRGVQPIYDGAAPGSSTSDKKFAVSAQDGQPARPPGYRNAWDDCGGVGASATERMRTIASKIKGWAKPLPFIRHAAQDCGSVSQTGTEPGPGAAVNYPGPEIPATARKGLATAAKTLAKY